MILGLWLTCGPWRQVAADSSSVAPDAFEQNKRLGRGVNVLGWDPGWRDPSRRRFQDEHFRLIHDAGFNSVRVVLQPFEESQRDAEGKISPEWLGTLDWAIDQALANHLIVDLDFHEYMLMSSDPAGNHDRFLAMWSQIARHCRERPNDVLFELLNEPHGKLTAQLWNQYLSEALAVIRKSNPNRTVVVGPGQWNGIDALKDLEIPETDRNIIVTVHYYRPMSFTHQGTPWTEQRTKTGVTWEGTEADRQAIIADFNKVEAWAKARERPIFLGEFGAYDKADMDSRARWTSFVARQAEARKWSWAYWQFTNDFVLYDIPHHRWVEPIRQALVPPGRS